MQPKYNHKNKINRKEVIILKKEYETPELYIVECELENIEGNLCSQIGDAPIYEIEM